MAPDKNDDKKKTSLDAEGNCVTDNAIMQSSQSVYHATVNNHHYHGNVSQLIHSSTDAEAGHVANVSRTRKQSRAQMRRPAPIETNEKIRVAEEGMACIRSRSNEINGTYTLLRYKCTSVKESLGRTYACIDAIGDQIDEQQGDFHITTEHLLDAISQTSMSDLSDQQALFADLVARMETIAKRLGAVPQYLEGILDRFMSQVKLDCGGQQCNEDDSHQLYRPDQEFFDVMENVIPHVKIFYSLVAEHFKRQESRYHEPTHEASYMNEANQPTEKVEATEAGRSRETEAPEQSLERLHIEGLTSSTLLQCLSRACPVDSHRSHTIVIALSTDDFSLNETHIAIQSRVPNDNRAWLRVQSTVNDIIDRKEQSYALRKARKDAKSNLLENVPIPLSRKRKLSPDANTSSQPPRKKSRRSGRRMLKSNPPMSDSAGLSSKIEVCPEYLAQGSDPTMLVMRMVGASKDWHNIYFLDAEKRPADGKTPIQLTSFFGMMDEWDKHFHIFWRARVARLVAQAALRIQSSQTPCHWSEKDVIFYGEDGSFPFLRVEIDRQDDTAIFDTAVTSKPRRWLLDLALLILQLGLNQHIETPPRELGDKEYCGLILRSLKQGVETELASYLDVVRRCAEFDFTSEGNDDLVDEQNFRKQYFELIVLPLRRIEAGAQE